MANKKTLGNLAFEIQKMCEWEFNYLVPFNEGKYRFDDNDAKSLVNIFIFCLDKFKHRRLLDLVHNIETRVKNGETQIEVEDINYINTIITSLESQIWAHVRIGLITGEKLKLVKEKNRKNRKNLKKHL